MKDIVLIHGGGLARVATFFEETEEVGGAQLIYSWPIENQDDEHSYGIMGQDGGANDPMAMPATFQALQLTQGGKLASIKLFLNVNGGALCDVIVEVRAAAGAAGAMLPTGPALATSDVILNAEIAQQALNEFVFSGANQIDLQAGQLYAFVFTYSGTFPVGGQQIYLGMNWVPTLPNNVGFTQGGWQSDDYGTLTLYLYAT